MTMTPEGGSEGVSKKSPRKRGTRALQVSTWLKEVDSQQVPNSGAQIIYERMHPLYVEEFRRAGGLAHERICEVKSIVDSVLPDGVTTRIRLSGEFTGSVDAIVDHVDSGQPPSYRSERGANVAVARTIPAADGSFDIVMDAQQFLNLPEDSDDEKGQRTENLRHTAAHEPQHVLLHLSRTDSDCYEDDVSCARTPRAYRKHLADGIDEYRCELAANRIALGPTSRESVIGDDLAHMRDTINAAVPIIGTDFGAALFATMTAVYGMFKALAYLAAECVAAGKDWAAPQPAPPGWDRYFANLWPDIVRVLSRVPAADEYCERRVLIEALEALCVRFSEWMNEIGIRYENREDGQYCWWEHAQY
jgi:hypothetical protein